MPTERMDPGNRPRGRAGMQDCDHSGGRKEHFGPNDPPEARARGVVDPRILRLEKAQMTDHQQAAIEAVDDALRADQWDGDPEDLPGSMTSEAEIAVEAAEPHLRKKWAEKVREIDITQVGGVTDPVTRALKMAGKAEMKSAIITLLEGAGDE